MKANISFIAPFSVFLFAVFAGFVIYKATWFGIDKHFSLLAQSFLHNDLFLSPFNLPDGDYVDFNGKQYLFFGPMPSVLLIPPVLIWGKNFPQVTLSIISLVVVYLATFFLCRKFKISKIDSFWLSNFFVFGTVLYFVGLVNISAYVVQAVGTAFFMLALLEYFTKRRWWLIGILVGAAGATRITLFGASVFFIFQILANRRKMNWTLNLSLLMVPIIISIGLLGVYNFRRFHSFADTGYTRNVSVLDKDYYNHKLGWFSPVHIPANLYALFLMPPEPVKKDAYQFVLTPPFLKANGWGMAIWFTSPLFIYLLLTKKEVFTIGAVFSIGVLMAPSLFYFGIGASQFGYRYSLDFLPFLFLISLPAFKKGLPDFAKLLIAAGIIFNCFYMLSIWNSYPLLSIFEYLK